MAESNQYLLRQAKSQLLSASKGEHLFRARTWSF
jgi:hypothetical protein